MGLYCRVQREMPAEMVERASSHSLFIHWTGEYFRIDLFRYYGEGEP